MNFKLIKATEADKPFLFALRELTMTEHFEKAGLYLSDDEHRFRINDFYDCSYLIIDSGVKVGTLKYRELSDEFEVMQLQIHPIGQGKGLGTKVMKRVMRWSRDQHKKIILTVLKDNPAKFLYQRLGFVITGEDSYEYWMELKQ